MTNRRKFIQNSLLTLGAAALPWAPFKSQASNHYGIVGHRAPSLKVDYWIDKNGLETKFDLDDHEGKWVFLKCFQSWCPGCHSHGLPALKKISDALIDNTQVEFAAIQTVFEGRSVNTVDKVRETQLQYDLKLPMGHDDGQGTRSFTMADYRTGGTPWMILISPSRKVIFNDFGINADKTIEFLTEQTKKSQML